MEGGVESPIVARNIKLGEVNTDKGSHLQKLDIKVATRDINFGISIKVPQKVDLKILKILRKLLKKFLG